MYELLFACLRAVLAEVDLFIHCKICFTNWFLFGEVFKDVCGLKLFVFRCELVLRVDLRIDQGFYRKQVSNKYNGSYENQQGYDSTGCRWSAGFPSPAVAFDPCNAIIKQEARLMPPLPGFAEPLL